MNSSDIIIRNIEINDAASKTELDRSLVDDGRGMVLSMNQIPRIEDERERLESFVADPDNGIEIVAVAAGNRVVANAQLRRFKPQLCQHVGMVALGVHPDFQGQGLGRRMMKALLEQVNPRILQRIELYVRADNFRAIKLYKSLGFRHEGTREAFIRLENGKYVDDLIMVRFFDHSADGQ